MIRSSKPNGTLTDVPGIRVGHYTDPRRATGCTVVLCPDGTVGGVDVRGAAPGTRETELLQPHAAVSEVHAVLLSGGSAYGLDAATGVMQWLEQHGTGLEIANQRVPIVPAAIIFDLWHGDGHIRPDAVAGHAACQAARNTAVVQGSVGAGTGATVGKLWGVGRAMKGGVGSASVMVEGVTIGALAVVNALGDVLDPTSGQPIAGARTDDGARLQNSMATLLRGEVPLPLQAGQATTLVVVATDATLTKAQAQKLAQMAHDGLARSINPVHTMGDGDVVFALATGEVHVAAPSLTLLGSVAAEVTARAVVNAVQHAHSLPGIPAIRDMAPVGDPT